MKHPPQEADLVPGRMIAGVTVGVVVAIAAGVVIAWGIGRCSSAGGVPDRTLGAPPHEVSSMERRVFSVQAQGIELDERADAFLSTYGWVDRDARTVHVPIGVAFDLYLARRGGPR